MRKNYVWVCNDCLPPEGTEVKSLGHIGPGKCHVCEGTADGLNYTDRKTANALKEKKECFNGSGHARL